MNEFAFKYKYNCKYCSTKSSLQTLQENLISNCCRTIRRFVFTLTAFFLFSTKFGFQKKRKKKSKLYYNALGLATKLGENKSNGVAVCMETYSLFLYAAPNALL